MFTSADGAALLREAEVADRAGLECLKRVAATMDPLALSPASSPAVP